MLEQWEDALSIEHRVYPNLVRVFHSNIELFATRLDGLVNNVGEVPIEFSMEDLNSIIGTERVGLELYTSRKELKFNYFLT